jgi:hypothetical protein
MRARKSTKRLTLLDVITTVSRLARDEREAAAVINHLFGSAQLSFANRGRGDLRRMMTA